MLKRALVLQLAFLTGALALSQSVTLSQSPKRLNKIVQLLEAKKPAFGIFGGEKTPAGAAETADVDEADFVFYDMETGPFDVEGMRVFMQFLLHRGEIARTGSIFDEHPVVTRIPPIRDGRVEAQDRVERVLDAGVHGVVFPHVESREDAELAVASMRFRPEGRRPIERRLDAPRYWGVSDEEYRRRADLWPVSPQGELVNLLLIEDKVGIANARQIVSTPGASIVIPGPGDLRRAYAGDMEGVEKAIQTTLAACKEYGVACGITAGPDDIEKRLDEGFLVIIVTNHDALAVGRRSSGRS